MEEFVQIIITFKNRVVRLARVRFLHPARRVMVEENIYIDPDLMIGYQVIHHYKNQKFYGLKAVPMSQKFEFVNWIE